MPLTLNAKNAPRQESLQGPWHSAFGRVKWRPQLRRAGPRSGHLPRLPRSPSERLFDDFRLQVELTVQFLEKRLQEEETISPMLWAVPFVSFCILLFLSLVSRVDRERNITGQLYSLL